MLNNYKSSTQPTWAYVSLKLIQITKGWCQPHKQKM